MIEVRGLNIKYKTEVAFSWDPRLNNFQVSDQSGQPANTKGMFAFDGLWNRCMKPNPMRFQSGVGNFSSQRTLNPPVPRSLICLGSCWHRIDTFWPLWRDCTRLGDRRMSWISSKRQTTFFIINWSWNFCKITRTLMFDKNQCHEYHKLRDFLTFRVDCATLREHWIMERVLPKLQFMIVKRQTRRFDTISKTLWPLSLVPSALRDEKSWNLWYSLHWIFGTDVSDSIYDNN